MEIQTVVAEIGGGAAAAIVLTAVVKQATDLPGRYLPALALFSGWGLSLAISTAAGPIDTSAIVLGLFAGLSAVGAYRATQKAVFG